MAEQNRELIATAPVELAERAGHARPSMSLDVYSHVMPTDEVPDERFSELIRRNQTNAGSSAKPA